MFENDNMEDFDLMMKSVLDEAQEEVPERVWEGVSSGLDTAARRRTVVLRWRRSAVAVAAAAAVVLGVFLTHNTENQLVPAAGSEDMIAVVEQEETAGTYNEITDNPEIRILTAKADEPARGIMIPENESIPETSAEEFLSEEDRDSDPETADIAETSENKSVPSETKKTEPTEKPEENIYFPVDWGEEQTKKKRDVALMLSGIAGTNNAMNKALSNEKMMRPEASPAPKKTGIEETSTKSSYGIPLSFGAGVKIGLSERWSIGTGVNYTFLSRQFYGKYTKVGDDGGIERVISADIRNQQHYVGIPVNFFYDVISNDKISFYAYAGGAVEKCLSDSYRLLNTSISHDEKTKGVQLSANAGIGVEFMLGEHLGLYVDPSVRYYFDNGQPKSVRTVQPLMLGFELGFRARL